MTGRITRSAIGAVLMALLATFVMVPQSARAANNPYIKVSLDSFTPITQTGEPITNPGQMYLGDWISMVVSFDASDADPVPGDSFTVVLPTEFINIDYGRPGREVNKPLMFGTVQVGTCTIEQRNFTCTFNESIVGQERLKGTISARLAAAATTTNGTVVFDLNGLETEVTIPGTGGIGQKTSSFTINPRATKGASGIGMNSRGVTWNLNLGGAWLVRNLPGQTEFTIIDTLPNELLTLNPDLRQIFLSRSTPASNGVMQQVAHANGDVKVEGYSISVTPEPDGLTYRIKVTVPYEFNNQENYSISFPTVTTNGGVIDKGWTYTNSFRVEGVDQVIQGFKGYVESFSASASYEAAMGSFSVIKTATGAGELSPDQKFAITVNYELPSNFVPPAGWTPPPNPFTVNLPLGVPTINDIHLPAGTKVTVTEDLNVANTTAADGVTWVAPTWSSSTSADTRKITLSDNASKASFTIEDQNTIGLSLVNKSVTQSTFQVVKRIVGDGADSFTQGTYDFTYTCTDPATGTVTTGAINDVPGDGTAARPLNDDGSERTFPVDSVCTISETDPGSPSGYTLTKAADTKIIVMNAVQTATMVNTYEADAVMFSIVKDLNAGNSRGMDTFAVHYECTQDGFGVNVGDPAVPRAGEVTITAGQDTPVGRFPEGTQCRVVDETDQLRDGFDLTKELGAPVVLTAGGSNKVTVTNTYTMQMGSFKINKVIAGDEVKGIPSTVPVTFAYTCTPPLRTGLAPITGYVTQNVDLATGGEVAVNETFPVNSECVVTGESGAELAGYSMSTTISGSVKISKNEVNEVTVTNTYTRDHGEFTITKDLADGGSTGLDDFTASFTCTEPARDGGNVTTREVTITSGVPVAVGSYPSGTVCQVNSETPIERTGYSQEIQITDPVTLAKDQVSNVTVRNIYTRDYTEFLIAKQVIAGGSTGADTFTIHYDCDDEGMDRDGGVVARRGSVQVKENQSTEVGRFPTGTRCEAYAEDPAERTNFDLATEYSPAVTLERDTPAVVTVTNTYTPHMGTFRILKEETGLPVSAAGKTVSLMYQCTPPLGLGSPTTGTVDVEIGVPYAVGQFPVGTECKVTAENAETVTDYTLATDMGAPVTIVQGDDAANQVTVTNTYTRDVGYFSISKNLEAGGSTGDDVFTVTYRCEVPATDAGDLAKVRTDQVSITAGQTKRIGEVPVGSVCVVTGEEPAERDNYDLETTFGPAVTIAKDQLSIATVSNTYTRHMADFIVEKQVVAGGSTGSDQFTLRYECELADAADDEEPTTGYVTVTQGQPTVVGTYPTGTVCRITGEATDSAARDGYNLTVDLGSDFVVGLAPDPVPLVVVNTYTRKVGSFEISKSLVADGSTGSDVFTVLYECAVPGEADPRTGIVNVQGGTTESAGSFPTGTVCKVTGEENTDRPGWTLTSDLGSEVTITEAGPNVAAVTNTYSRDHGTFAITKVVNDGGSTGTETFTVSYACTAAGKGVAAEGTINVTAGQETVVGEFPTGTECRVTDEDRDAATRDGYSLGVSYGERVTIEKDTKSTVTVSNSYERQRGGFIINKTVAGDAVDSAPKTFSFTYTCADSAPVTVEVTAGQPLVVADVPTGQCAITEADASVQYTDLVTEFTVDGVAVTDGAFEVKDQATTEVGVTNTYTAQRGTFEVTKEIVGGDDDLDAGPFTFTYDCGGATGALQVPGDGTPVAGPELPLGTSCIIAEETASAEVPGYELTPPAEQAVELTTQDEPATVHFVNTYRRHTADFAVTKTVTGGDFAASTYTFNYTCGDVTGSVEVTGDGVPVAAGVNLPTGTVCTITEDSSSAVRDGYDLTMPEGQQVVLEADGGVAELSFINAYTKQGEPVEPPAPVNPPTPVEPSPPVEPPAPTTPPKPTPVPVKPGLPATGK